MSALAILTFNTNDLRGTLPSQLGLLTSLFWFTMCCNMLTGMLFLASEAFITIASLLFSV